MPSTTTFAEHVGETVRVRKGTRGTFTWTEGTLDSVGEDVAIVDGKPVDRVDVLLVDAEGFNYRIDDSLGPWRMTTCCGASVKGLEQGVGCRSCFGDVEPGLDGPAVLRINRADARVCVHCGRSIVEVNGSWVDPEATGDDRVWRETCDSNDTFTAEHEPA